MSNASYPYYLHSILTTIKSRVSKVKLKTKADRKARPTELKKKGKS